MTVARNGIPQNINHRGSTALSIVWTLDGTSEGDTGFVFNEVNGERIWSPPNVDEDIHYHVTIENVKVRATGALYNGTGKIEYDVIAYNPARGPVLPTITTQPNATNVMQGGVATFAVAAAGRPLPSYQWFKNGSAIPGATASTLTVGNAQLTDAAAYTVRVSNTEGSVTSHAADLAVLAAVEDQSLANGRTISFSAGRGGAIRWQIFRDGNWVNLEDGPNFSGTSTDTLTVNMATSLSGHQIRFVATNGATVTASSAFRLFAAPDHFPHPTGIAVDPQGNLYVADASNNGIHKIHPNGNVTVFAGTAGQAGSTDGVGSAARFNQPSGLTWDAGGDLYVADTGNATLRRISPSGSVSTFAGSPTSRGSQNGTGSAATFNGPVGLYFSSGMLYVADSMNHAIRRLTGSASTSTFAGSAGVSGSAEGNGTTAARFHLPQGVAADANGNIYVSDTTNNTIRKITPAGSVSTLAGVAGVSGSTDGTGSEALFNQPTGLAVDASANVYVADTGNATIRKISPTGVVTTLAGLSGVTGHKNGTGNNSWFTQPRYLALRGSLLYVADTGNASIRKVTLDGTVSTVSVEPIPPLPPNPTPGTNSGSSSGGGGGALGGFVLLLGAAISVRLSRRTSV